MYPKLRPDVYIAESPEGAVLVVDGKTTHLKGTHAAPLLERLVPHLDGTRSLHALTAPLRELLAEHKALDAALDWHIEPRSEGIFAPTEELLRQSSLVVAVGPADALLPLNTRCVSLGVAFLPVLLGRSFGLIGP